MTKQLCLTYKIIYAIKKTTYDIGLPTFAVPNIYFFNGKQSKTSVQLLCKPKNISNCKNPLRIFQRRTLRDIIPLIPALILNVKLTNTIIHIIH